MQKALLPLIGLLLVGFMIVACDDVGVCEWFPTVETNADGSCTISTSEGQGNCWGGVTVTCTLNEGSTSYFCDASGEDACDQPIEFTEVSVPSCDWFLEEANTEIYAEVWADCWGWEDDWFYW